jgi:DNA polymerase
MGYFLPNAVIGEAHGKPQQVAFGKQMFTVIPLYHPAAALYNGALRQTLIDDFLAVPKRIQK